MRRRRSKTATTDVSAEETREVPGGPPHGSAGRDPLRLSRLTMAAPPPFVGREDELASLRDQLSVAPLVVVHGAVGSGKTRLARHLADSLQAQVAYVRCQPGDRGVALRS